jgi:hypothetical protein
MNTRGGGGGGGVYLLKINTVFSTHIPLCGKRIFIDTTEFPPLSTKFSQKSG